MPASPSVATTLTRDPCRAGASPKRSPVASDSSDANRSTRPSTATSSIHVARADRGQGPLQHEGEPDAQDAAGDGEQHAFRQELPGKTPRPRAERGADGELALTPGAARQEKVGDVGSGDEQDEPDRRRQHEERRPHAGDHFRLQRD
jgi:hypothetical protein